ncbi:MAG: hypothetical protein HYU83_00230 [Chloroflexi bacterium]|nr:hypothetical protein [Chloroflexota bacterium]
MTEWPGSRPNPPQTLPSRPDPRPIGGDHRPGTTTPHLPTGNPAPIQLGHDRPGYRPSDRPADRPVFRPGDRDGQRRDDDRRDNDRWRRDNDRRDDDRWRRDNDRRDGHDGWCRVHNRRDDCWRTYPRYGPSVWLPAPRPYHDEGRVFIDCRARVYRDTVYVSACDLMRQFDGTYYWDPACGRASLGYGCRTAFVSLGSSTIVVVDGERRTILPCANAPVLVNGELYVPVRTVCEGLGIAYACDRDHIQLGSRFVLVVKF